MATETVAAYAASSFCPTSVVIAVVFGVVFLAAVFMVLTVAVFIFCEWKVKSDLKADVVKTLLTSAYKAMEVKVDELKAQLTGKDSENVPWDDDMSEAAGRGEILQEAVIKEQELAMRRREKGIQRG